MPFDAIGAKQLSAMAGMLPQAHTCDNLLELPNYWAALCARAGVPVHSWRDGGGRVNALIAELRQTVDVDYQYAAQGLEITWKVTDGPDSTDQTSGSWPVWVKKQGTE